VAQRPAPSASSRAVSFARWPQTPVIAAASMRYAARPPIFVSFPRSPVGTPTVVVASPTRCSRLDLRVAEGAGERAGSGMHSHGEPWERVPNE